MKVGGDEVAFRVTAEESTGTLTAIDVRMPAGGGPPMMHRHEPFEVYRVDKGELTIYLEDLAGRVRSWSAGPGDVVSIPGGRMHTVRNESGSEARAYVVFTPGAQMEGFIRAAASLTAPDPASVSTLAARHGIEMGETVARARAGGG